MTLLAIVFAFSSAVVTAVSTSVQHQAAGHAPPSVDGMWGLLLHLARRRIWLLGQLFGFAGFGFHALALSSGPISLVQPIVITGIVFAVPVRAAFTRQWPVPREMAIVALTAAALAVFLVASDPSRGHGHPDGLLFPLVVAACGLLGALVFLAGRAGSGGGWAFLLGSGSGLFFGLVAVLVKTASEEYADGGLGQLLGTWPVYAVLVAGITGVAMNQVSYRSARLSATMPVLNVVDCLLGLGFGYLAFAEMPRHSPVAVTLEVASLAVICVGLWLLARYEEEHIDDIAEALPRHGAPQHEDAARPADR